MRTVLKYPGGKNRIAKWICGYLPKHKVYLEPYFGGGAVFFNKDPCRIETINDIDGNVVNFFRVLRNQHSDLIRLLNLTPYSGEEYNNAFDDEQDSDLERARKFCVRCWQGFGCSNIYKNGFRSSQQSSSPDTTKHWREMLQTLEFAAQRLKDAQIECMDALELIDRYNTKDVFIYADPPYLTDIRKQYLYKYEMTQEEHIMLLEKLLNHPGKVMISGYESQLYNDYLKGWGMVKKDTQAECGLKRTEVLWMNYTE